MHAIFCLNKVSVSNFTDKLVKTTISFRDIGFYTVSDPSTLGPSPFLLSMLNKSGLRESFCDKI